MPKKDDQLNVRIGSGLKAELSRMAQDEDRSLAYVVERILREYVEAAKKAEVAAKPAKR